MGLTHELKMVLNVQKTRLSSGESGTNKHHVISLQGGEGCNSPNMTYAGEFSNLTVDGLVMNYISYQLTLSNSEMKDNVVMMMSFSQAIDTENWASVHPVGNGVCLLYTSPSPRDRQKSRMPSSA